MDLPETADALTVLFRLLHEPPAYLPPTKPRPAKAYYGADPPRADQDTSVIIPLPVIPVALGLADKYMLNSDMIQVLHSHIGAHVMTEPLKVYGLAVLLNLMELASDASEYLLHPPLSTYRTDEIKAIPTVDAYHQLIRLHGVREVRLREVLQGEIIFPHDYGICSSHGAATTALWEERKRVLGPRIRAGSCRHGLLLGFELTNSLGTDVAAEMANITDDVGSCKICIKACKAAVDMLGVRHRLVGPIALLLIQSLV